MTPDERLRKEAEMNEAMPIWIDDHDDGAGAEAIAEVQRDADWKVMQEQLEAERALSERLWGTLAACHDALGEIYHGTPLSGDWLVEETGNGAWRDLPDEIRDTLAAYAAVHPEEQG